MKNFLLLIISICLWQNSFSQTVPLDSVKFYDGKTITVCSKVQGTYLNKGEKKNTYLNFGADYPNATFMAMIFETDLVNFKYVPADFLKGKNICITGKVSIYKDKPQIIITTSDQVKVE